MEKVEDNLSPEKTAGYLKSLIRQVADTDDPAEAAALRRIASRVARCETGEKATRVKEILIDGAVSAIAREIFCANMNVVVWRVRYWKAQLEKADILLAVAEEAGHAEAVTRGKETRKTLARGLDQAVRDLTDTINAPEWDDAGVEVPEVPEDLADMIPARPRNEGR
ncbi:hypothetical protein [Methanofollis ethanolicus]|uniref:hypothetical protein n=1 Tax=Methanofollis ethanolicus TaxID=488124 RepID=UPI00082B9D85|nr:hypothetical protein [Methanofollis ethanolicus]